jgi:hypothetical protein
LYSCSTVDNPSPVLSPNSPWSGDRRRLCGFGTGVISSERRRVSIIRLVG